MEDIYIKIEAYLSGNMTQEEMTLFEEEIRNNRDVKEEVNLYNELHHYLKARSTNNNFYDQENVEKIKSFLQSEEAIEIEQQLKNTRDKYYIKPKVTSKRRYIIAATISILMLLGSIRLYTILEPKSPEELYATYYKQEDLPFLIKRNDSLNPIYRGITLFQIGDYEKASSAFHTSITTETKIDTLAFLYIGMTYLELNQEEKALEAFDIVTNSNLLDKSKGIWFKALAYLKNGNKNKAKIELEKLTKDTSNFNYNLAIELLDKL